MRKSPGPIPRALPLAALGCLLLANLHAAEPGGPVRLAPGRPPVEGDWRPAAAPQSQWRWPLAGRPRLVRAFAPPPEPWLPGHRGVDLAGAAAATVFAAGAGTIRFAGPLAGRGVISIEHADGLRTTYEPVTATVAVGDQVAAGMPIATLTAGHAGCLAPPPGECLHWGLRRGDEYLDPLSVLGLGRVRLLPVR